MPEVQGNTVISPEELKKCADGMNCTPNDIMAQAPVRYYKSDGSEWKYTGVCGCLALTADMTQGIVKLTLVDFKTNRIELEQELYEGFEITQHNNFFHSFEADDHVVGLCFADDFDAARFSFKVVNLLKLASQVPSTGMPTTTPVKSVVKKPTNQQSSKTKTKEKSGGWFSGIFGKKEPEKPKRPTKLAISGPKNFVHVSHIGYNPKDGFGEIPAEWKELFQSAGIREEELKDPKTAAFIMKTINAQQEGNLPPPPPPPPAPGLDMKPKKIPTEISTDAPNAPPPPPKPTAPVPTSNDDEEEGGRGALLAAIRKGTSLKKISQVPDVKKMTSKEKVDLASTLRMAMESRREAVESDDDEEEEDEW